MRFIYLIVLLGAVFRLFLLVARPSAAEHFSHPRRRLLALRFEQGGDLVFLLSAAGSLLFGGRSSISLGLIWFVGLMTGLAMVAFAHEVARRHRPAPPDPTPSTNGRQRAERTRERV